MIFGNPQVFAIDSDCTQRVGNMHIGWFTLLIGGFRFGVKEPEATALGCSIDSINNRLAAKGRHIADFGADLSAAEIADAIRLAVYSPEEDIRYKFSLSRTALCEMVFNRELLWAPDGDKAFDDGSYVLHFDVGSSVRLIGFRGREDDYVHAPATLRDVTLSADEFYDILGSFRSHFSQRGQ